MAVVELCRELPDFNIVIPSIRSPHPLEGPSPSARDREQGGGVRGGEGEVEGEHMEGVLEGRDLGEHGGAGGHGGTGAGAAAAWGIQTSVFSK